METSYSKSLMLNSTMSDLLKLSRGSAKRKRDSKTKPSKKRGTLVPQSLLCHPLIRRANVGRREVAVIGAEAGGLADHEEGELRLSSHRRKLSLRATMPCRYKVRRSLDIVRPGLTQRLMGLHCHPRRIIGSGWHHLNPILLSFRKLHPPWKPSRRLS